MEMTIIQAVLCGVVYWLAVGNLPFVGLWSLQRPLVCGAITGLILGHPVQGAVIGATIADNFGVEMPEGTIGHSILQIL